MKSDLYKMLSELFDDGHNGNTYLSARACVITGILSSLSF